MSYSTFQNYNLITTWVSFNIKIYAKCTHTSSEYATPFRQAPKQNAYVPYTDILCATSSAQTDMDHKIQVTDSAKLPIKASHNDNKNTRH